MKMNINIKCYFHCFLFYNNTFIYDFQTLNVKSIIEKK